MMKGFKLLAALWLMLALLCASALADITVIASDYPVDRDGWYDTMEEVAVYLTLYDELPENYMTKKEAQKLGWVSSKGNLWDVADGCSIGGDRFGNYEGLLPEAKGRKWTECDIDFDGSYRGAERIVFSNDGLIYYTGDHYESFEEIEVVWSDTEDAESSAAGEEKSKAEYDSEYESSDLINGVVDALYWLFAE